MLELEMAVLAVNYRRAQPNFSTPSQEFIDNLQNSFTQSSKNHDEEVKLMFEEKEIIWGFISPPKNLKLHRKFDRRKSLICFSSIDEKDAASYSKDFTKLKLSPKSKRVRKRSAVAKFYRSRSDSYLLRYHLPCLLHSPIKSPQKFQRNSPQKVSPSSNFEYDHTPQSVRKQLFTPDSGYHSGLSSDGATPCNLRKRHDLFYRTTPSIPKSDNICANEECFQQFKRPLPPRTFARPDIGHHCNTAKHDIIGFLAKPFPTVLRKILKYLEAKDLTRFACVSTVWKTALCEDAAAEERRYQYVCKLRALHLNRKENMKRSSVEVRNMTPTSVPLSETQVQAGHCRQHVQHPTRHELFFEEGKKLKEGEKQTKCKCGSPARVSQQRAVCTNNRCQFDFCLKCLCESHGIKPCQISRRKLTPIEAGIGTRNSKRNLRRL